MLATRRGAAAMALAAALGSCSFALDGPRSPTEPAGCDRSRVAPAITALVDTVASLHGFTEVEQCRAAHRRARRNELDDASPEAANAGPAGRPNLEAALRARVYELREGQE